ncbi:hypothetical protein AB8E32_01110 [Marinomonas polaris]|uniref:hypothetical protein n=1 Tax=Marinomonas polaris TaxID=293552 RepID=UPI0035139DAA
MKASLSAAHYAALMMPYAFSFPELKCRRGQFDATKLRDFMEFQGHCLTIRLSLNKQSMPYDKNRLARRDVKQNESDVWAIAR